MGEIRNSILLVGYTWSVCLYCMTLQWYLKYVSFYLALEEKLVIFYVYLATLSEPVSGRNLNSYSCQEEASALFNAICLILVPGCVTTAFPEMFIVFLVWQGWACQQQMFGKGVVKCQVSSGILSCIFRPSLCFHNLTYCLISLNFVPHHGSLSI